MRRCSLLLVLVLTVALPRHVQDVSAAEEIQINLRQLGIKNLGTSDSVAFTRIDDVKDLPPSVIKLFSGGLANPGERFQATDVIGKERLPFRRLIFGAAAPGFCLLHFEKGGIAVSDLIVLFRISGEDAKPVWSSDSYERFSTLSELNRAMESRRLKNRLGKMAW